MAPRKARPLEVLSGVDPGLDHRPIGHDMTARRDHVAEGKAFALEVAERVDRGIRLRDEKAMELLVDVALYQRHDAEFLMSLHVSDCAENGEVERAIAEALDGCIVILRNGQLDWNAQCLAEIGLQR